MYQEQRLAPSGQEKASSAFQYSYHSSSYQSGRFSSSSPASSLTSKEAAGSFESTPTPAGLELFTTSPSALIPRSAQGGYSSQTYSDPLSAEAQSCLDRLYGPQWRYSNTEFQVLDVGSGNSIYGTPTSGPASRMNEAVSAQSEPIYAQKTRAAPVTDYLYDTNPPTYGTLPTPANRQHQHQHHGQHGSSLVLSEQSAQRSPNVRQIAALPKKRSPPQPPLFYCEREGCTKKFTREKGRDRPYESVHREGNVMYLCANGKCGKTDPRKDKMMEHCRKRHGHEGGSDKYVPFYYNP